jgi:transposase-like protein
MRYVVAKNLKAMAAALKRIYTAATIEEAEQAWMALKRSGVTEPSVRLIFSQ